MNNKIESIKTYSRRDICADKSILQYSLGGLLYTPAHNEKAAESLVECRYGSLRAQAFCLEDAIADCSVEAAENQLYKTFSRLSQAVETGELNENQLPFLFVRVRNPKQMERVFERIGEFELLTGFIFPKFDNSNAFDYIEPLSHINTFHRIYGMPILESQRIIDARRRRRILDEVRTYMEPVSSLMLNVRIGGNDFCNLYGLRRGCSNTIYDIGVVRDAIVDIFNIFGSEYVVSAPVWEYFGDESDTRWLEGMKRELELDRLNGLIGKTAIHPTQLEVINDSLKADANDYCDALSILQWQDKKLAVSKSIAGNRMNEQKVHEKWACRVLTLAGIYGIKNENTKEIIF